MARKSRSDRPTAAAPAGDLTHGVLFGPIVVPGGGYVGTDIPHSSRTVEPI